MIVRILIILPFLAVFFLKTRPYSIWAALIVGASTAELFSPLPFGIVSIALGVAVFTTQSLLRVFDAFSYISLGFVFSLGVFLHTAILAICYALLFEILGKEIAIRGFISFLNEELMGLLLGLSIIGIRYGIREIRYAFVEKKII